MIPAIIDYRYAGFYDPPQKITGDSYKFYYGIKPEVHYPGKKRINENHRFKKIYELICSRPGITNPKIAQILHISENNVRYYTEELLDSGKIYSYKHHFYPTGYKLKLKETFGDVEEVHNRRAGLLEIVRENPGLMVHELLNLPKVLKLYEKVDSKNHVVRFDLRVLIKHDKIYRKKNRYYPIRGENGSILA